MLLALLQLQTLCQVHAPGGGLLHILQLPVCGAGLQNP